MTIFQQTLVKYLEEANSHKTTSPGNDGPDIQKLGESLVYREHLMNICE